MPCIRATRKATLSSIPDARPSLFPHDTMREKQGQVLVDRCRISHPRPELLSLKRVQTAYASVRHQDVKPRAQNTLLIRYKRPAGVKSRSNSLQRKLDVSSP